MRSQYVDLQVSRGKFDREIEDYRSLESTYRERGWFLIETDFPSALVLMAAPQLNPPAVVTGVAFDYTNYDAEPPSVQLVNPFTREPYLAKDLPTTLNRDVSATSPPVPIGLFGMQGIQVSQIQPYMQWHSLEEVPFLCVPGVREYHLHPAHNGDAWELHRTSGAGRLVRLLELIYRYGVEPIRNYGVQLVPKVAGFQAPAPS